jgi:O-antigen ligase
MRLLRLQLGLVAAVAATCSVSIFAAQVFFALAALVLLVRLGFGATSLPRLAVDGPLLAFAVWTLLSAAFSADPWASHQSAKKLVLFALLYLAVEACAETRFRERAVDAALLGALALSALGVLQFLFLGFDTLNRRPLGFLGHYMTASGLAATALVLALARIAFASRRPPPERRDAVLLLGLGAAVLVLAALERIGLPSFALRALFVAGLAATGAILALRRGPWPGPSTSLVLSSATAVVSAWALVVSQTRNAWLGAVFGLAAVLVLRAPRTLWLLGASIAVLLVARPASLVSRLTVTDASSVDRYYMWQAGLDMLADKPVFGQGPGMILRSYPLYRWAEATNPRQPHLHDNALQIAAERGLPALAFWVWMMAALLGAALTEARRAGPRRFEGPAACGVLATLLVAGIFEYNFGDSEVLMFTLLAAALPFAARRERARHVLVPSPVA